MLAVSVLMGTPAAMAGPRHDHRDGVIAAAILSGVLRGALEPGRNKPLDYRWLNNLGRLGGANVPIGTVLQSGVIFGKLSRGRP